MYLKSGNFCCKNISMAATKINLTKKCMHTINVNMVRGHSYKNFQHDNLSYKSFLTRKFQIYAIHIPCRQVVIESVE